MTMIKIWEAASYFLYTHIDEKMSSLILLSFYLIRTRELGWWVIFEFAYNLPCYICCLGFRHSDTLSCRLFPLSLTLSFIEKKNENFFMDVFVGKRMKIFLQKLNFNFRKLYLMKSIFSRPHPPTLSIYRLSTKCSDVMRNFNCICKESFKIYVF